MYKVFISDSPLILTTVAEASNLPGACLKMQFEGKASLHTGLTLLEEQSPGGVALLHEDEEMMYRVLLSHFTLVDAGGGLVRNRGGELLGIYRNGMWDLPKGKCETGEDVRTTALREVQEECGIKQLEITGGPFKTHHVYHLGNRRVLKRTYWFEMQHTGPGKLTPQSEEGISEARWLDAGMMPVFMAQTYASIRELLSGLGQ